MSGLCVFVATWLLIAGRRWRRFPIGRPAGALLGAAAMVALGALTPAAAYRAVDGATLLLLLAMMLLGGQLAAEGSLDRLEVALLRRFRTPMRLLLGISLLSAALSAILVNDTVCVLLTPIVIRLCRRSSLPLPPYLLAIPTAANIGSAATLVGNPQNMLIAGMSGMGFADFLARSLPATLLALAVHLCLLAASFRRALPARLPPPDDVPAPSRPPLALAAMAAVTIGFLAGLDLAWTALAGAAAVTALRREDPEPVFRRVDWTLLVFFAALFVVVAGFEETGLPARAADWLAPRLSLQTAAGHAWFAGGVILGSNTVSNVPLVMLVGPWVRALGSPELAWVELAFVSTLAGNLTLVGSVANLIVAESARAHHEIGFFEYLRLGAVSTVLTIALGVPALHATWVWMGG